MYLVYSMLDSSYVFVLSYVAYFKISLKMSEINLNQEKAS